MQRKQRVADMANEVLRRLAKTRADRTGEPLEEALEAILETEAGRQLGRLRSGPHRNEMADRWQEDLTRKRDRDRSRALEDDAIWERFMRSELRELELRKDGQLAKMLGEPLPGESRDALQRLASEDRRQAQEGLVALMSNGKVSYKHVDELSPKERPARIAASSLRTTWLKERLDGWLGRGEDPW